MKPAAFLFDLDGTLVDTESAWAKAISDMLAARGEKVPYTEILSSIIGRNWYDIHRAIHETYPVLGDSSMIEDAAELRVYYARHSAGPAAQAIPGSVAFLRRASAVAPCAIVSGSPREDVLKTAEECGFADCIRFALGAGDYPRGKPDPSGFLAAAEKFGARPAECVVVEDSAVGVAAGVAAGMRVVALKRPGCDPEALSGAELIVEDLSGIDPKEAFK